MFNMQETPQHPTPNIVVKNEASYKNKRTFAWPVSALSPTKAISVCQLSQQSLDLSFNDFVYDEHVQNFKYN